MRTLLVLTGIAMALGSQAAAPASAAPPGYTVTFEQTQVSAVLGERFTLRSQVRNAGTTPTGVLLAHLNVASLTSDVYVDPEDWSANRSRQLPPAAPGATTTVAWDLQAVNAGSFDVYVVLLPAATATAGVDSLIASPPLHVTVTTRRTLNAAGALPVVLAVPALLGLFAATTLLRTRRRHR